MQGRRPVLRLRNGRVNEPGLAVRHAKLVGGSQSPVRVAQEGSSHQHNVRRLPVRIISVYFESVIMPTSPVATWPRLASAGRSRPRAPDRQGWWRAMFPLLQTSTKVGAVLAKQRTQPHRVVDCPTPLGAVGRGDADHERGRSGTADRTGRRPSAAGGSGFSTSRRTRRRGRSATAAGTFGAGSRAPRGSSGHRSRRPASARRPWRSGHHPGDLCGELWGVLTLSREGQPGRRHRLPAVVTVRDWAVAAPRRERGDLTTGVRE